MGVNHLKDINNINVIFLSWPTAIYAPALLFSKMEPIWFGLILSFYMPHGFYLKNLQ